MRQKVPPTLIEILHNRIYIARATKAFSLKDIWKNWGISESTFFRYDSPHDREVSRLAARRTTLANKDIDRTICHECSLLIREHPRCLSCTMLVHGDPECGCGRCIDSLLFAKLFM